MNEDSNNDNRFSGVIGEDYDSTVDLLCPHLTELEETVTNGLKVLKTIFNKEKLNILDLGSGDGLTAKPILRDFSNISLTILDNEKQMITQAKKNLVNYNKDITFILEDCLEYLKKSKDNSIHGIASCFVLHNFNDNYRLKVLKEVHRVLKPKGIFVNADKIAELRPRHDKVFLKQMKIIIDNYTKANRPDLLREWSLHYLEDNIPGVLWFEKDAISQLKAIGFKSVENTFRCDLEATLVATKS